MSGRLEPLCLYITLVALIIYALIRAISIVILQDYQGKQVKHVHEFNHVEEYNGNDQRMINHIFLT